MEIKSIQDIQIRDAIMLHEKSSGKKWAIVIHRIKRSHAEAHTKAFYSTKINGWKLPSIKSIQKWYWNGFVKWINNGQIKRLSDLELTKCINEAKKRKVEENKELKRKEQKGKSPGDMKGKPFKTVNLGMIIDDIDVDVNKRYRCIVKELKDRYMSEGEATEGRSWTNVIMECVAVRDCGEWRKPNSFEKQKSFTMESVSPPWVFKLPKQAIVGLV